MTTGSDARADRDLVQAVLAPQDSAAADLRRAVAGRSSWARSFTTAAYRLALGRLPDEGGLDHHAGILDEDRTKRASVLRALNRAKGAAGLEPAPPFTVSRRTPGEILTRLHDLQEEGRRRDVYLAEVLASVEELREELPAAVEGVLARSAVRRDQDTADRALAHVTSARTFTSSGAGGVTVVDVAGLLLAVPGDDWAFGARLALRGDPQAALTEHADVWMTLRATDDDVTGNGLVVVDVGSAADAGLAALRAARGGQRVHVVEADERARDLIVRSAALNGLELAGAHADVRDVAGAVDAVRVHGDGLAAALDALRSGPATRAWAVADVAPTVAGWEARGVPGAPLGTWELRPAPASNAPA